jgi:nitrite transporter NirC
LTLVLLLPHDGYSISWAGFAYNLGLSTFGNIIGGAIFVGGLYWLGSPNARTQVRPAEEETFQTNGAVPVGAKVG